MIETAPLFPATIPLAFFIWAPVLVMVLFWLTGLWTGRQGLDRALESDWNGFTREDVDKLFALYGEEKRAKYRKRILPADTAFAFVYTIVGAVLIVALMMRGQPIWVAGLCGGGWLLGGLCDIAENLAIARLLDTYPKLEDGNVAFASRITVLKIVLFLLGTVGALAAAYLAFKPLAG